mgnify:CR=1 FL=1|jgi:hypothetical protein
MNILAIDCATKSGFASLIDGRIESGIQDFTKRRGESNGMLFLRFNAWLSNSFVGARIDVFAYERAHHRGGAATEICVGLTTRVQEYAVKSDAEHMAVHAATIKKFVTGSGRASKEDVMAWFKKTVGRDPVDDNEADARALLEFVMMDLGVK